MKRKELKSGVIKSVGYNEEEQVLELEFNNGAVWQYFEFTIDDWNNFNAAESKGKYFLENIKGKFKEFKID